MPTLKRRCQSEVKVQFAAKTVFFQHVSTRNICRLSSSFKFQSSRRSSGKNSSKKALDTVNKAKQLYGHSSACHKDPSTSLFEAGKKRDKNKRRSRGRIFHKHLSTAISHNRKNQLSQFSYKQFSYLFSAIFPRESKKQASRKSLLISHYQTGGKIFSFLTNFPHEEWMKISHFAS